MHRGTLAQIPLWATCVQAFYPYIPTYACDVYHGCDNQDKRSLPLDSPNVPVTEEIDAGEPLTLKLFQKSSPHVAQDPAFIAARQAARLRRKYEEGFKGFIATPVTSENLDKRDNTFSIMTAETPAATNSIALDQDGSDISYFIQAEIGSNGDPFYMLCDTGAGSTWVMGSGCTSTACSEHTTWDSSTSSTYSSTGKDFSIAYGTGSVKGALVEDSIAVGSVKITMSFGVANTTSTDFEHFAFDGILGLSMASAATDNFINSVQKDKSLSSTLFSVDLNRASDGTNTGEITFGGTDSSKYTGSITYTSVDSAADGAWAIPIDNMGYNGKEAGIKNILAYIDTGTTYAFGPSDDVAALHALIDGAESADNVTFTAPCDTDTPITVTFSGVAHTISSEDWLSTASSKGVCTSNIYGQEVVSGAFLLGDVFLKNVYAVFDVDNTQIGFASKSFGGTSSTSTSTSSAESTSKSSSTSASSTDSSATSTASAAAESAGASATKTSSGAGAASAASGLRSQSTAVYACILSAVVLLAVMV
ncbi:aspartic peptidase domain-containing protein [Coniella lustricola]|uniref:Aspartic peptidase domain-containing protein n=1 Tax=Coniella lustricola TaxID=2025994 RepID=A0A2T2ZX80_9PEZI|nr:aspartic peptidase domain-containing protein [Coniella lustricola]